MNDFLPIFPTNKVFLSKKQKRQGKQLQRFIRTTFQNSKSKSNDKPGHWAPWGPASCWVSSSSQPCPQRRCCHLRCSLASHIAAVRRRDVAWSTRCTWASRWKVKQSRARLRDGFAPMVGGPMEEWRGMGFGGRVAMAGWRCACKLSWEDFKDPLQCGLPREIWEPT
jgi:hypothetical protein